MEDSFLKNLMAVTSGPKQQSNKNLNKETPKSDFISISEHFTSLVKTFAQ